MYSFWHVITSGVDAQFNAPAEMMEPIPTIDKFAGLRGTKPSGMLDHAYRAMFFNHTAYAATVRTL